MYIEFYQESHWRFLPDSSEESDLLHLDGHVVQSGVGGLVLLVRRGLVQLQCLNLGRDVVNLALHAP